MVNNNLIFFPFHDDRLLGMKIIAEKLEVHLSIQTLNWIPNTIAPQWIKDEAKRIGKGIVYSPQEAQILDWVIFLDPIHPIPSYVVEEPETIFDAYVEANYLTLDVYKGVEMVQYQFYFTGHEFRTSTGEVIPSTKVK